MMHRVLAGALMAVSLLGACGETPQTLTPRKADTAVYSGTTDSQMAAGWKPGDAATWEAQMKARAQNQNEYSRASAP